MGASKVVTTILISIILTVVLISMVNVGTSIFLERPEYQDYTRCGLSVKSPDDNRDCSDLGTEEQDYCCMDQGFDEYSEDLNKCVCTGLDRGDYDTSMKGYNQTRYYIFAGIGFILMLLGLFIPVMLVRIIGLSAGGILVTQGIVFNLANKWLVFITLGLIFAIIVYLAVKVINKLT